MADKVRVEVHSQIAQVLLTAVRVSRSSTIKQVRAAVARKLRLRVHRIVLCSTHGQDSELDLKAKVSDLHPGIESPNTYSLFRQDWDLQQEEEEEED